MIDQTISSQKITNTTKPVTPIPKPKKKWQEQFMETLFLLCASFSVLSVALIAIFIFAKGMPGIIKIGLFDFLLGTKWAPEGNLFGILPMIITSLLATLGAIAVGGAIGISVAIYLAELASVELGKIIRPAVQLMAGIPSVVYGFFGLVVIVPAIARTYNVAGDSLLAVIIILTFMILPTVVNISEVALRAVPKEYKEASLGMGATHIQTIFCVMIPAAKSGILAAIILGIGRAIGETMAVILVAGNTPLIPASILAPVRTMTANIAIEMGYSYGLHQDALFSTGVVLFVFIMALNLFLNLVVRKGITQ